MRWKRCGKTTRGNGEQTITYESVNPAGFWIESRKRLIPHAGGRPGGWLFTSYYLIDKDGKEKEYYSLRDAKEAALERI